MSSKSGGDELRLWYCGGVTPPADLVREVVGAAEPQTVYAHVGGERSGEYAGVMTEVVEAMTALQRNALPTAARGTQQRMEQLLSCLLELAATPKQRVEVLRELGAFRFRRNESKAVRQQKLSAAVRDPDEGELATQAAALAAIWKPAPDSFVETMLLRPAEAGRVLMRRASGRDGATVSILVHGLGGVAPQTRDAVLAARAVAYQRDGVIHLLGSIGDSLRTYAASERGDLAGAGLQPLPLLLVHELVEGLMQGQLGALAAHVAASTFERCLGGLTLKLAVEACATETQDRVVEATAAVGDGEETGDVEDCWADCFVDQDEIRPEAYEPKSLAEQRAILREMFGEDWSEEDDAALEEAA